MNISEAISEIYSQLTEYVFTLNKEADCKELVSFIESKLSNPIPFHSFEEYHKNFGIGIKKTLNKKRFIKLEIESVNKMLDEVFCKTSNGELYRKTVYNLILMDESKQQVTDRYYTIAIKSLFDIDDFVRVVYSYDLIKYLCFLEGDPLSNIVQQTKAKAEQEQPKTFEELFCKPEHAEPCLKILSELQPPVIDAINNYIGKAKGVFPLWVKVLKNHKPEPLIKHFKDTIYKDLLNQKVIGLNLSKDASEFRKHYVRLENDKIELDIKAILSLYSHEGKLGK